MRQLRPRDDLGDGVIARRNVDEPKRGIYTMMSWRLSAPIGLLAGAALLVSCSTSSSKSSGSSSDGSAPTSDGGAATSDSSVVEACGSIGEPCCAEAACAGTLSCKAAVCLCQKNSDCPSNGVCEPSGACLITLASGLWNPQVGGEPLRVAVGPTSIYWTNYGTSHVGTAQGSETVMSVPKTGGTITTLATEGVTANMVVDSTSVYWFGGGNIMKAPLGGGTPSTVVPNVAGGEGLATDGTRLYWTRYSSPGGTAAWTTSVESASVSGGSITTLDSTPIVASGMMLTNVDLVVDATTIYWVATESLAGDPGRALVMAMPKGGGTVTTLAPGGTPVDGGFLNAGALGLAVNSSGVYWTVPFAGSSSLSGNGAPEVFEGSLIEGVALEGGVATVLASPGFPTQLVHLSNGITADDTSVYWTDWGSGNGDQMSDCVETATTACGSVQMVPARGGKVVTLATHQRQPTPIAVDANSVYWLDLGDGVGANAALMRLVPKPTGTEGSGNLGACGAGQAGCDGVCVDEQTDNQNCGGCGTACQGVATCQSGSCMCPPGACGPGCSTTCNGTCNAGQCTDTLASGQSGVSAIALNSTNVYWLSGTGAWTVALAGGTPTSLVYGRGDLAVDATNFYFRDEGSVVAAPLDGGSPVTLCSACADVQDPTGAIVVDPTSVYWGNDVSNTVLKVAKTGGAVVTLASGGASTFVAVDATSVYWGWNGLNNGVVLSVPLSGGTPTTLATGANQICGMAVDATRIYWTLCNEDNGSVMALKKAGGMPVGIGGGNVDGPLVSDGTNVYFTTFSGLLSVPVAGGTVAVTLATDVSGVNICPLAVDATSVYYAGAEGNALTRITPK